jgi:hypothetical protein
MKFNRKGKFVVVQTTMTWVTDQFLYYTSSKYKDWLIIEFDHFFQHNKDVLKSYSSGTTGTKPLNTITTDVLSTLHQL